MVTMKGNEDNEVNSYFWVSAQIGMNRRRAPESGGRKEDGEGVVRKVIIFKCLKRSRKEGLVWQSLMDPRETFVVL